MNAANLDGLKLRCEDEWTRARPQRHDGHTETFTPANRASTSHEVDSVVLTQLSLCKHFGTFVVTHL